MQRPATPPHAISRNPVSKRKALSSTAALLGLSGGALGWAGLAEAAEGERSLQTLLLPDHYQILDDGTVVFALKTGEQMSLSEEQYVLLDGGLVLVVDELAQNAMAELPVMGSLRTQLMTEIDPVRNAEGNIVEVSSAQPLWSGEGPTPRLFEQVDVQSYELAQDGAVEGNEEDGLTIWGVARSAALASFGLGFGPSSLKFTSGDSVKFAEGGTGTVYQAAATDDNGRGPEFSMGEGGDSALFSISADGALTFKSSPDYETPLDTGGDNFYEVQINGTYRNGKEITKTVTVEVTNVAEGPAFTSGSSVSFEENGAGTVYTAAATNEDGSAVNTFALVGGADQTKFSLTSAGVLTFDTPPDFENPSDASSPADNDYEVEIQATGSDGQTVTQQVTVSVTNAREAVLYDIDPGSSSGNPGFRMVEVDGKVYFTARNATIGSELFEFDINTKSVTGIDIYPGLYSGSSPYNSSAEVIDAYDGTVYIRARDTYDSSDTQYALWTYNANDGLNKVDTTAIRENIDPKNNFFIEYGGVIYFAGKDLVSDGAGGFSTDSFVPLELMSYDPSTGTVTLLTDFESLNGTSNGDGINTYGSGPALVGDDIYFWANSSGNVASQQGSGHGIYKYNITNDTLTEMDFDKNIVTGGSNVTYIFEFDDKLWLTLENTSGTYDLYSYSGTGSALVQETNIGPSYAAFNHWFELGGNLYITNREDWTWYKFEPGSAPLTYSIANAFSGLSSFGAGWPPVSDSGVYFSADDGTFGQELWLWDGTSTSPERLTDINIDSGNGVSRVTFVASDDSVFLSGNDGLAGTELWVYG